MKNELRFSTQINRLGNVYELAIDLEKKEYRVGYFLFIASETDIDMKKKEIDKLAQRLEFFGFKKV